MPYESPKLLCMFDESPKGEPHERGYLVRWMYHTNYRIGLLCEKCQVATDAVIVSDFDLLEQTFKELYSAMKMVANITGSDR